MRRMQQLKQLSVSSVLLAPSTTTTTRRHHASHLRAACKTCKSAVPAWTTTIETRPLRASPAGQGGRSLPVVPGQWETRVPARAAQRGAWTTTPIPQHLARVAQPACTVRPSAVSQPVPSVIPAASPARSALPSATTAVLGSLPRLGRRRAASVPPGTVRPQLRSDHAVHAVCQRCIRRVRRDSVHEMRVRFRVTPTATNAMHRVPAGHCVDGLGEPC